MERPISLVTDRTMGDVLAESDKGSYNASDLNRVQEATKLLCDTLTDYGYASRLNYEALSKIWTNGDLIFEDQMDVYLQNVQAVLAILQVHYTLPNTVDMLDYEGANNIERALMELDDTIYRMELAFVPCGEAICGGDNL